jgi:hypothetical protein
MANTPLDIYQKAYQLHYEAGDLVEACALYKEILKKFPESNECGYAVIQLQKIGAQEIAGGIEAQSRGVPSVVKALLTVNIIVVIVLCAVAIYQVQRINKQVVVIGGALNAVAKISLGQENDALQILSALRTFDRKNPLPVELSARIHVKKRDYAKAISELQEYQKLSGSTAVNEEIARVQAEMKIGDR